ncbi:MAG TPA: hypothetical protein VGO62_13435 [Myxococcota bacterium]|jgi:hypothetical protein
MAAHVRTLEAEKAAAILEKALAGTRGDVTIADAATKGGMALREAELGLHFLSSKYRGTLSATENGDLLFRFPYGFSLPFTKRPGVIRFWEKLKRGVLGVGKLVVRAWISVVLVGYVAAFVAILVAMIAASNGRGSRGGSNVGGLAAGLIRVISEAFFWTFHPFSPFYAGGWDARTGRRAVREQKAPFYERVNRFVFGPEKKTLDAREIERRLLAQIRSTQGRIGIADVMRITGLPREEADPVMARLMLDYEGEVEVSDDGGIFYKFPALRRTAQQTAFERPPPPVWNEKVEAAPVTGNDNNSNLLIAALNGFNLVMSLIALQANWTIDRLTQIVTTFNSHVPVIPIPYDGTPWIFGIIPFLFSTALFALPVYRWATQGARVKKAKEENARRAVLKTVLDATQREQPVHEADLQKAWHDATGEAPNETAITEQITALGGDVDLAAAERGERSQFRFRDLEAEVEALKKERQETSDAEKDVGVVVFKSS